MPIWILLGLGSAVFAALVAVFGKIGVAHIDTTLATTVRAVIMAAFLVISSFIFGKFELISTIDNKALQFIALSGLAGALSWLFYFWALKQGPTTGVASIDRTSVIFVLIFSALILGDKFNLKSLLGVLLIAAGAIIVAIK
jgi:bacterial/archaeal transporter family protein